MRLGAGGAAGDVPLLAQSGIVLRHNERICNPLLAVSSICNPLLALSSCAVWRPTVPALPLDVGSNQKTGKAIAS